MFSCLNSVWKSLDDEVALKECDIYSYVKDMDDDALSIGKMWEFLPA